MSIPTWLASHLPPAPAEPTTPLPAHVIGYWTPDGFDWAGGSHEKAIAERDLNDMKAAGHIPPHAFIAPGGRG